ncbi:MAG: hypothetical protein MJ097_00390 [Dorea sp.]|nr:hypothetical protein [Dorea sp.]
MKNAQKLLYQSGYWYNDALRKAKARDLTGACASLKKSLQYNRSNVDARNLLGLCMFGRGDVMEALTQWILSKNYRTDNNMADDYIQKVCGNSKEFAKLNQAAKSYNNALIFAREGKTEEAEMLVKKAIENNPEHVKAYQLYTLLALEKDDESLARQMIHKAYRLDVTDPATLRYMHEINLRNKERSGAVRTNENKGKHFLSYNIGNETIIQPVNRKKKTGLRVQNLLNIVVGLLIGLVATWFLIVPAMDSVKQKEQNEAIVSFSDKIAAQNAQINALKKELDDYRKTTENPKDSEVTAAGTKESYEIVLDMWPHYQNDDWTDAAMVEELMKVNPNVLAEIGKTRYDEMTEVIYGRYANELFNGAQEDYSNEYYQQAVEKMELLIKINEKYGDGYALTLMAQCYEAVGEQDKANLKYQQVLSEYPDSDPAYIARAALDAQNPSAKTEPEDGDETYTDLEGAYE